MYKYIFVYSYIWYIYFVAIIHSSFFNVPRRYLEVHTNLTLYRIYIVLKLPTKGFFLINLNYLDMSFLNENLIYSINRKLYKITVFTESNTLFKAIIIVPCHIFCPYNKFVVHSDFKRRRYSLIAVHNSCVVNYYSGITQMCCYFI